jgi:aminoglycoside phosphotransferase (APT) family kinase protein
VTSTSTRLDDEGRRAFVEEATGRAVADIRRRPAGGRRQAYEVHLDDGDVCFLRYDPSVLKPWDPYSLRREAGVYRALAGSAVPVARVLGVHPEAQAVLLSHARGRAPFTAIGDPEVQRALQDELVEVLVALHALDPRRLDLPELGEVKTTAEHLEDELDVWETMYTRDARPDPLLTAGFIWLRAAAPAVDATPSLVQGDTGPGNFLHEGRHITAVVDWEFAHFGDPMEDLAWVSTRSVQEPLPDFAALVRDYGTRSGRTVDPTRIRYYRVLVELRIGVLGARRLGDRPRGGEVGNGLAFGQLHRKLLVDALVDALGLDIPALGEPEPPDDEDDWLYEEALDQLRKVVLPAVADPFAQLRTKGVARLVKYCRANARWRDAIRTRTAADLAAFLGDPGDRHGEAAGVEELEAELDRRLRAGTVPVAAALPVLARKVQREVARSADVMGVLARRGFDPIA